MHRGWAGAGGSRPEPRGKRGGGEGPHETPAMCKGVCTQSLGVSEQMRYLPGTSVAGGGGGSAEKPLLRPGESRTVGSLHLLVRRGPKCGRQHSISSSIHKSREFTHGRGLEPRTRRAGATQQPRAWTAVPALGARHGALEQHRPGGFLRDGDAVPHCPYGVASHMQLWRT